MSDEWFDSLRPESQQQLLQARKFLQLLRHPERKVVELAVQGLNDKSIAEVTRSSEHTIRRHIENVQHRTPEFYGQKLKFRQQLVPMLAPYLFLMSAQAAPD